jgi:hypothetical protein
MNRIFYLLLFMGMIFFTGCSAVEAIFKAGMWWAFILIFGAIFLVTWIFLKSRKK